MATTDIQRMLEEFKTTQHVREQRLAHIREIGGERYQAFLTAGYGEWYLESALHCTPYLLQKCIYGAHGDKLYYINVWVYDFQGFRSAIPVGWQPEADFTSGDLVSFHVVMHCADTMTPQDIEAFFQRQYEAMECEPYERCEDA